MCKEVIINFGRCLPTPTSSHSLMIPPLNLKTSYKNQVQTFLPWNQDVRSTWNPVNWIRLNVFESWNRNFQINLFSFLSSTHEHLHASTLVCWTKYAFKKFQSKIFCLRICLFYYRWYDTPHAMTTMVTWATSPVCYAAMTRQIGHISIGRLVEEKCEPLVPWRKAMEGYLRG